MVARGHWVPAGWYLLERSVGGSGKHLRLGVYCSLDCLVRAKDDLSALGSRSALPAEATDRDRARLLGVARTLLHSGLTIRQAGDQLDLPTSTLRHWLREDGVEVGVDGTLLGLTESTKATRPVRWDANPVSVLNELAQTERIRDLEYQPETHGPPHAPTFACTASVTIDGESLTATEIGDTKAAAKSAAAAAVLESVRSRLESQ